MHFHSTFLHLAVLMLNLRFGSAQHDVKLLPPPSGPFEVAINSMELIDETRLDPFAPTKTPRAIMVSAIYPTQRRRPSCRYPYMPSLTALLEDEEYTFPNGSYESLFLQVGCNSNPQNAPLVLFSPAEGNTRLDYSLLVSNIASYGFTVVMMDHPYDADYVEFPDGSYIQLLPLNLTTVNQTVTWAIFGINVRVQDTTFVLDQLSNATVVRQLIPHRDCALDTSSVAMFGHSLGGATAASAMVNETRIIGGLNMDGAIFGSVLSEGLDKPFLLFSRTNNSRLDMGYSPMTWTNFWSVLRGWKLELELADSLHYSFSDFPTQFKTMGLNLSDLELVTILSGGEVYDEQSAEAAAATLLKAPRAMKIVVEYVVAFLKFVLEGKDEELLLMPSPRIPEVTFVT